MSLIVLMSTMGVNKAHHSQLRIFDEILDHGDGICT